ncbi:MAG: hypothetical protein KAH91_04110 [Thermoplasmatales archaeon]|nr:hypothetical protein [Thermoplasmatales archaeon]
MRLSRPPEPVALKKQSKKQKNERDWKIDSLVLWFGNRLPSYLWKEGGWSKPLKDAGFNWQSFLKILSLHKKDMIQWSRGGITWNELLFKIEETIKNPIFKKILIGST